MESPKLCIDCRHFSAPRNCSHYSLGIDLVDGKRKTEFAAMMRLQTFPCTPKAVLFEPMEAVIYDLADLFPAPPFPSLERTNQ